MSVNDHAGRRANLGLPEPDAEHGECQTPEHPWFHRYETPCYRGQWTLHGPHDYPTRTQNHAGVPAEWRGREVMSHCPGKTQATLLGASAGGRA